MKFRVSRPVDPILHRVSSIRRGAFRIVRARRRLGRPCIEHLLQLSTGDGRAHADERQALPRLVRGGRSGRLRFRFLRAAPCNVVLQLVACRLRSGTAVACGRRGRAGAAHTVSARRKSSEWRLSTLTSTLPTFSATCPTASLAACTAACTLEAAPGSDAIADFAGVSTWQSEKRV